MYIYNLADQHIMSCSSYNKTDASNS